MKSEYKVIGISIILGLFLWIIDTVFDYLFFYEGTFWELLTFKVPSHEIYIRSVVVICFFIFGILISRVLAKRKQVEEALSDALRKSRQHRAEALALLKGSRAVSSYYEFKDTARSIFDSCKNLIGATGGYIALLSKDGTRNEVLFLDSGGRSCAVDPSLPMPIRGLRAEVYRTGKVVYHNDFSQSEWVRYIPEGHLSLENVLFAPLLVERKVVGLLGLANKPGGFTKDDARLAVAFSELAAVALYNSRLLESIRESEERFRSVAQSATDAIISVDSQGKIIFWNRAAEIIFGYSADETIGKPLTLIMPERFREAHGKGLKQLVSTGKSNIIGKTVEMTGLRKDGNEFPLELSLSTWRAGDQIFFTGIIRDITGRKRAEKALEERQELVQSVAVIDKLVNTTLDINEILEEAVTKISRAIGTPMASIFFLEGDKWIGKANYGFPNNRVFLTYPKEELAPGLTALSRKQPVIISGAETDPLMPRRYGKEYNIKSALVLPLFVKEKTFGCLWLTHCEEVSFTPHQVEAAFSMALSTAIAIENARLYEKERAVAETLQEALLAKPLEIPGLEVAFFYESATEIARVGGDFYDVFELEQGKVGLVIGDVVGHGLKAATMTALTKSAIRVSAYEDTSPASVLERVNQAIYKESALWEFVTLLFGALDITSGKLIYSNAGHPPAFLVRRGGEVETLFTGSAPIGAFADIEFEENMVTLKSGELLFLYTDGVVEARADGEMFSEMRLQKLLKESFNLPIREVPKVIFNAVNEYTEARLADDIAMMAIRRS